MIKTNKYKLFIILFIIISLILFTVITIYCYRKQSYTQTSLYLSNKKFMMQNTDILLNNYMKENETSNNENNFKVREIGKALLYGMRSNYIADPPPNPEKFPSSEQLIANYYDTETSIYCAYLVNLAYSLNANIVYNNQNNHRIAISFLSNELIKTTSVAFRIVDLLSYHCTLSDSYSGFIIEFLYPKPIIIIALRVSANKCEWYEDLKFYFKNPSWGSGGIEVHRGYNNIYMNTDWLNNDSTTVSIRLILAKYFSTGRAYNSDPQNIQPKTSFNTAKIIITGHSLGGGISNLITADMALNFQDLRNISKIFTFAAPCTGNQNYANLIDKNVKNNYSGLFQIINTTDIIATEIVVYYVRPKYQLFCFTGGSNIDYNPLNAHYIQTYMTGVKMNKLYFNANAELEDYPYKNISIVIENIRKYGSTDEFFDATLKIYYAEGVGAVQLKYTFVSKFSFVNNGFYFQLNNLYSQVFCYKISTPDTTILKYDFGPGLNVIPFFSSFKQGQPKSIFETNRDNYMKITVLNETVKNSNQIHYCGLDLGVNLNQIDVLSNPLLCK